MAARIEEASADLDSAISSVLSKLDTIYSLKEEQRNALKAFVGGKDVFALHPTDFGKSLIYQMAPLVVKELGRVQHPIVIVVSPPVNALIEDQIREVGKLGLAGVQLGGRDEDQIIQGRFHLVFGSPEAWLNKKWRSMLTTEVYVNNLVGIVVDVTYKWGEGAKGLPAFKESFARLGKLRSIVKEGTPVIALTASTDIVIRAQVTKMLEMEKATQIVVSPNRQNIRLGLKHVPYEMDCLDWVVTEVREKKLSMSPVIIYCTSLQTCARVFCHFKAELGEDAWVDRDPEHKSENMLIGMFHSITLPKYKERVLASLMGEGSCRVVVATTALGLGFNFPNVSHVVMYGAPGDVEDIVQHVGRAGRNSLPSHAVLYAFTNAKRVDKSVKALIQAGTQGCLRTALFSQFEEHTASLEPGHRCCTYCHSQCTCSSGVCEEPTPNYESEKPNVCTAPLKSREVTEEDKTCIRECLEEYRRTLVPRMPFFTGFGTELIEAAVEHSPYIFDLSYVTTNLPVLFKRHACEILLVISEVFEDFEYTEPHLPEESFTEVDINFTGYFDEEDEDSSDWDTI